MTVQRFQREYLWPRKPVVIADAYALSPLTATKVTTERSNDRWSFAGICQAYGHVHLETLIPMQHLTPGTNADCTASGLCEGPVMTLAKLFNETFLLDMSERVQRRQQRRRNGSNSVHAKEDSYYTHDLDLETTLPDVFDDYQKLSIFTENLHLATRSGNLDRWPSLFLGPATTKTGLHVDNLGTSFTMAVFRGRKQFVLFDVADGNRHLCLNQPGTGGLWSNYGIDVFLPNFRACPRAKRSHPMFASLGPGDLLYVPGSMHHAARNMDDSIGIAQHFLTFADYHAVVESHKGRAISIVASFARPTDVRSGFALGAIGPVQNSTRNRLSQQQ